MSGSEIATWIQAIGSAGSLLAFAAWVGIAILTRRDDHERHFAHQARSVAAWIDEGERYDSPAPYVVCIANGGENPVYRCSVALPGLEHQNLAAVVHRQLVPPHSTVVVEAPAGVADFSDDDLYEGGVAPLLDFTDSSGRHWHRDEEGRLNERSRPADDRNRGGRA